MYLPLYGHTEKPDRDTRLWEGLGVALRGYTGIGKFREMFIGKQLIQLQREPVLSPVQNTSVTPKSLVSLAGKHSPSGTKRSPPQSWSLPGVGPAKGGSVESLSWAVAVSASSQLGGMEGQGGNVSAGHAWAARERPRRCPGCWAHRAGAASVVFLSHL